MEHAVSYVIQHLQGMDHAFSYVIEHLQGTELYLILASWASGLIGTVIYYVWQHEAPEKNFRNYLQFTFPLDKLLTHKDVRMDVMFTVLNRIMEPLTVGLFLVTIAGCSAFMYHACTWLFGPVVVGPPSTLLWLAMIVMVLIVQDFCTFWTHFVEHKIPVMWAIHQPHHSPEFMIPLTNRRHHPLQLVWEGGVSNISCGIMLGVVSYFGKVPLIDTVLIGTDAYYIMTLLCVYHLRHSHIPLHFGPLEKWLLSPAAHQLHHSVEVKDWDKNFGLNTAIWDRLFGTWNPPVKNYKFRIGLQPHYHTQYDTVWKFWTSPLVAIAKILWSKTPAVEGKSLMEESTKL